MKYHIEKNTVQETLVMLPNDPIILVSTINMKLRDEGISLQEFCDAEGIDRAELEERLAAAGFRYDGETNRFR